MNDALILANSSKHRESSQIQSAVRFLFMIFSFYLVVPVADVPLLSLSLSAPVFFFIAMYCIIKPPYPWFQTYRKWIIIAALIWAGIFMAAALNGLLSGGVNINSGGVKTIVRYAYWLLVFVITVFFASQGKILAKTTEILGWGIMLLALLRWGEVLVNGNIGAWTGAHLMTQNSYGIQFSTFSPFLFVSFLRFRGTKKLIAGIGSILLLGAVLINGSRGSWVSIGAGLVLFLFFLLVSRNIQAFRNIFVFILIAGITALIMAALPKFSEPFLARFNTFESIDQDKSYAIRLLMNQKSIRLFARSPIIGVGAARFRLESVELEIPEVLGYAPQSHFDAKSSHNSYLSFLAENGLLGAVPFAVLLGILAIKGFTTVRRLITRKQLWALGVFLAFVQMSIHLWALSSLTNTVTWFIYGLVGAMVMIGKRTDLLQARN